MNIPIEDTKWHRFPPEDPRLPKNHYAEYTRSGGALVVRITGPHAHVTGEAKYLEAAVEKALEWFSNVGGEL